MTKAPEETMAAVGHRADLKDARVSAADLYARHASHLFRFCLYQLRNRAEAEDAVQTTFLQAFRALQRGTVPNIERAWLIAIAHNVCRTMQRSSARRKDVETEADLDLIAGAADAHQPLREEISELEHALARIPGNQRTALVLHEWHGLRYREIAGVMGISQTAVEMLAFRARKSLSQALSKGSSRARKALDAGGILTALRTVLAGGPGVHALAGAGIAGLALATVGSSPAPVQRTAVSTASPSVVGVSAHHAVSLHVARLRRAATSRAAVRAVPPRAGSSVGNVAAATKLAPARSADPSPPTPSSAAIRPSTTTPVPLTTTTAALTSSLPSLPPPPAVSTPAPPQLPPVPTLTLSTPTVPALSVSPTATVTVPTP